MTPHLKKSRITKAIIDGIGANSDFPDAETRLKNVRVAIIVGSDALNTPAGQAATLTAAATAMKCFENAVVVLEEDASLLSEIPLGVSLASAIQALGAVITISQMLRLSAMKETRQIFQMELQSPSLVMAGVPNLPAPALGGIECQLTQTLDNRTIIANKIA
jgi:hypothetical protein